MSSASSSAPATAAGSSGYVAGSEPKDPEKKERTSNSAATADESIARQATNASTGSGGSATGQRSAADQSGAVAAPSAGPSSGGASVPMPNYAFFVKYTYSNECALLAFNFHEMVSQLGVFEYFTYRHDHRLISVTLAYIFYRYQVHHCDMALDLAVTLVYLEDVRQMYQPEVHEHNKDAFNLICYLAFLAHAFNADRTIRLSDWYKEIGWRSFRNCQQLNGYVFFLFSQVRKFRLRVSETRVKRYIRKLCSVPSQIGNET